MSNGSEVVVDCLSLLANLLRLNVSNQTYFRETGCVHKLVTLLTDVTNPSDPDEELPTWSIARRDKNLWGLLAIIQLFLVKGGILKTNQNAFWHAGVMEKVLLVAFSNKFDIPVIAKVCLDTLPLEYSLTDCVTGSGNLRRFDSWQLIATGKVRGCRSILEF